MCYRDCEVATGVQRIGFTDSTSDNSRVGGRTGWQMDAVSEQRTIVVTGGAGYIGSWVTRILPERGYHVIVLDRLMFGPESTTSLPSGVTVVQGDCRDRTLVEQLLSEADALVHLAGLVGDPACAVDESVSYDINVNATRTVAEVARNLGKRFVFASSCSVYGVNANLSTEESNRAPVSIYARNKCDAEDLLLHMRDDRFAPTILRFATIHGLSARPRFDLVVNLFAGLATRTGKITVFGGDQWRPFIHCADVAEALVRTVETDENLVGGEIFNIGSDAENYTIAEIGRLVQQEVAGTDLTFSEQADDERDYRVSFEKVRATLGFEPDRSVVDSIAEIHAALSEVPDWEIGESRFSNVKRTRELIEELRRVS